jgi:hypothetical protein
MLKEILLLPALVLLLATPACKTKTLVNEKLDTPNQPNNTDTYWSKGPADKEISAKLDLTSGLIEFVGKEGKKGFTKSMPFGQIQPGTYKFASVANEELVYQSGAHTITMSFSSPSSSLYLPLEGYRIMESMQPTLEVKPGNISGIASSSADPATGGSTNPNSALDAPPVGTTGMPPMAIPAPPAPEPLAPSAVPAWSTSTPSAAPAPSTP